MRIIYGTHTEKGRRKENQDAATAFAGDKISFFAVADGAGGLSLGRQASQMVVKAVLKEFSSSGDLSGEGLMRRISDKYRQMNEYINQYKAERSVRMATTLAMLHLFGNRYVISNIGDTQVFLVRRNGLQLISQIHNLAWASYLCGEIAFEDIRRHEGNHILTRALGGHDDIKPYIAAGVSEPGDFFLICTDGVYNSIDEKTIPDMAARLCPDTNDRMDGFCRDLVRHALDNGSSDNCTAVSVRVL